MRCSSHAPRLVLLALAQFAYPSPWSRGILAPFLPLSQSGRPASQPVKSIAHNASEAALGPASAALSFRMPPTQTNVPSSARFTAVHRFTRFVSTSTVLYGDELCLSPLAAHLMRSHWRPQRWSMLCQRSVKPRSLGTRKRFVSSSLTRSPRATPKSMSEARSTPSERAAEFQAQSPSALIVQ